MRDLGTGRGLLAGLFVVATSIELAVFVDDYPNTVVATINFEETSVATRDLRLPHSD